MPPLNNPSQKPEPQVKEITDLMAKINRPDLVLVGRAFEFSKRVHGQQKRLSGENYFIHPLDTAKILAGLGVGAETVAAGLLHDTLEDTGVSQAQLEKEFGREIAFLVEGVTKLGRLKYRGNKRHSESLRKLFVAMSQDIRVIVVKLADRLHNMRNLRYVPDYKQKRIAEETLEIYAPIAYRLGIGQLKKELEDLAFPFVYSDQYHTVKELLQQRSSESLKRLEKIHRSLQKMLAKEKIKIIKSDFRLKGLYSLFNKLKRYQMDINKIYDITALRIVVPEISDCYRVLGIIHGVWRPLPGRIKDYIAVPKPNGYRSIHTTVFTGDGGLAEIQIRTEKMHKEAEYGVASHFSFKENAGLAGSALAWVLKLLPFAKSNGGETPADSKKNSDGDILNWVKEMAEFQQSADQDGFWENLKADFFKERAFVFTPKGDVIDLPVDSSPIDFAYAVHSDIGNHTWGAKVNNKLVALDSKLKNGDIVEIVTRPSSRPTEKWLNYTKTATAQKHIRLTLQKNLRSADKKPKH